MASNKLQRINEEIQYALSELIRNVKDPRIHQGMISITGVETTGDLKYCKVYLSVLGLQNEKDLLKGLKSASGYLRHELGQRVKLRNVPELMFQLDRSIEYGAHINDIINKLEISEDTENDSSIDS